MSGMHVLSGHCEACRWERYPQIRADCGSEQHRHPANSVPSGVIRVELQEAKEGAHAPRSLAPARGTLLEFLAAMTMSISSSCTPDEARHVRCFEVSWHVWQAKLVKNAVEDALGKLKQSRPLTMQSPFEQRMACLSHISRYTAAKLVCRQQCSHDISVTFYKCLHRSIAGIVSSSDNPDFQRQALQLANSSLEDLPIKIQACQSVAQCLRVVCSFSDAQHCAPGTNTDFVFYLAGMP